MTKRRAQPWKGALLQLSQRNGSLELTPVVATGPDKEPPSCRARLIEYGPDRLIVERPRRGGSMLGPGQDVMVLAVAGRERWQFRTRVIGSFDFRLNAKTTLPALQLAHPDSAVSAQRRRFYRVSTTASDLVVMLQPLAGGDADGTVRPVGTPFAARLLNMSAGGIGVETPLSASATVPTIGPCFCTLSLPTFRRPVTLRACVAHRERLRDWCYYLGLSFEFADERTHQRIEQKLLRFTTFHERQQLQRQAAR